MNCRAGGRESVGTLTRPDCILHKARYRSFAFNYNVRCPLSHYPSEGRSTFSRSRTVDQCGNSLYLTNGTISISSSIRYIINWIFKPSENNSRIRKFGTCKINCIYLYFALLIDFKNTIMPIQVQKIKSLINKKGGQKITVK